jgi:hypothetical protein
VHSERRFGLVHGGVFWLDGGDPEQHSRKPPLDAIALIRAAILYDAEAQRVLLTLR